MSTTDRVNRCKPCPCGEGTIRSPDHPYARSSQTWYEGEVSCKACASKYILTQVDEAGERWVVLKPKVTEGDAIKVQSIDPFCRGLTR